MTVSPTAPHLAVVEDEEREPSRRGDPGGLAEREGLCQARRMQREAATAQSGGGGRRSKRDMDTVQCVTAG